MGARLILFTVFLGLVTFFMSLVGYQETLKPTTSIGRERIDQIKKEIADRKQAEILAAQQKAAAEQAGPQEDDPHKGPDLNDPDIQAAVAIYTGKGNCVQCHGQNAEGVQAEEGPMLAGQHDWYLLSQMQLIKDKKRVNEKMWPFVKDLSEKEFKLLSKYISQLRIPKE